jgi:hypothetical protein
MKKKQMYGIVIMIVGAIFFFLSHYIGTQVEQGERQVESGQRKVNKVNSLFSSSQYTKPIGDVVTGSAQERINQGKLDIAYYTSVAGWLQIGGIALLIVGAGVIVLARRRRS